jgi:hypothetical protein
MRVRIQLPIKPRAREDVGPIMYTGEFLFAIERDHAVLPPASLGLLTGSGNLRRCVPRLSNPLFPM